MICLSEAWKGGGFHFYVLYCTVCVLITFKPSFLPIDVKL